MLVLTRKTGESLMIGDDVKISILGIKGHAPGGQIRIGIDAPDKVLVYREEIYNKIKQASL